MQKDEDWKWRCRMAERLAENIQPKRFGVKAVYLIGSAKNAGAGPESDIDLLVHFEGSKQQKTLLETWLEGWSLCLDEINFEKTGKRTGGLLDLHFITDKDIENRECFALKINSVDDPARKLKLKHT